MTTKRIVLTIAAALLITASATGCSKPAAVSPPVQPTTTVPTTTPATVATTTADADPSKSSAFEPITSPIAGSDTRKRLLNAAREKLGTTSAFYVYQIWVQGDTALADLDPVTPGKIGRVFVAFERAKDGTWEAKAAVPFGSPSASASAAAKALPKFSAELIDKIDWKLAKPKIVDSASLKASLTATAKKLSATAMSGAGDPYKITTVKVAQDAKGAWWGYAVSQPTASAGNNYESLVIWAKYSGGEWTGKVQDPEPPAPTTYFPATVVSKLGL